MLYSLFFAALANGQSSYDNDDNEWAVCTLEGILALTKTTLNTIQPPLNTLDRVRFCLLSFLLFLSNFLLIYSCQKSLQALLRSWIAMFLYFDYWCSFLKADDTEIEKQHSFFYNHISISPLGVGADYTPDRPVEVWLLTLTISDECTVLRSTICNGPGCC